MACEEKHFFLLAWCLLHWKIEDKKLRVEAMEWVVKSTRTNGGREFFSFPFGFFDGCIFFYFLSVTCWCEKHNYSIFHPLHILTIYIKKHYRKVFALHTQLFRQSSSADTKLFSIPTFPSLPPATHSSVKQRKNEEVCAKALTLSLCAACERTASSKSLRRWH